MSMDIVELRLAALQQARGMIGDSGDIRTVAATLRLAARIESALLGRDGFSVCVDGLRNLSDEGELVGTVASKVGGTTAPDLVFNESNRPGDVPDECRSVELGHGVSTPVAGLDTATVGPGGGAVTASPPDAAA